jgi:hypothetical protein
MHISKLLMVVQMMLLLMLSQMHLSLLLQDKLLLLHGVQNQVNTLIAQNVATQLPIQANARATSKVDSISSLLSGLDLRRTGLLKNVYWITEKQHL